MITLKDVSLSNILTDINISIPDGGYIGIAGPNGSGKSTLARIIKGIQDPSSGTVSIDETVRRKGVVSIDIGLVQSNPENQLVSSSIEEDAAFGLENMNLPSKEIARRTEEALRWGGLWDMRDVPAHQLSAGQQQMLVLAGTMAMKPRYLVLDEATSMIDLQGRVAVLDAVKRINREAGVGIIHISHDLAELMASNIVILIDQGRTVWEGTPSKVHHQEPLLRDLGIDMPPLIKLKSLMINGGYDIDDSALTVEDMADEIVKAVNAPRHV